MYFLWFKNEDADKVLEAKGTLVDYKGDRSTCIAVPDAAIVGQSLVKGQGGPGQAFQRVELLELENGLVVEHEAWQQAGGGIVTANAIVHKT